MDTTTESIAHFIGLFQITVEDLRLRQEYKEFAVEARPPDEPVELAQIELQLDSPYELGRYDPGLSYAPTAAAAQPLGPIGVAPPPGPDPDAPPMPELSEPPEPDTVVWLDTPGMIFIGVAPGSVATVTYQRATLFDDDVLLNGLGVDFVAPVVLHGALAALADQANDLVAFEMPPLPAGSMWTEFAASAVEAVEHADASETDDAAVSILRGEEVAGVFVDGETVEELLDWKDHLPEYLRPEWDPEEQAKDQPPDSDETESSDHADGAEADGTASAGGAVSGGGATVRSSSEVPGGSGETVEGADEETVEHDFSRDFEDDEDPWDLDPGHEVVAGANVAINEIAIATNWLDASVIAVRGNVTKLDAVSQVNVLREYDAGGSRADATASTAMNVAEIVTTSSREEDEDEDNSDVLPSNWQVTRIDGDVITVNWLEQHTFATDFDRAEVKFSGSATYIGLGDNEIVNAAFLNEIGYVYDLIFVGGDMVDVSMVSQTNVLLDSDRVTTDGSNASGASTAGNLLWNQASLKTTGADQFAAMTEAFAEAAEELAAGAETIAREVAQDALFKGTEMLRVLHIDGDFAKVNLLKQTNTFGDADQVHLAMAHLLEDMEAGVSVITGSNALANIATVEEFGVDSTIMAAGQVYDDALLYQAELIESDAVPTGVGLSALTNEAVAFLAEDMIGRDAAADAETEGVDTGSSPDLDVMQIMLA